MRSAIGMLREQFNGKGLRRMVRRSRLPACGMDSIGDSPSDRRTGQRVPQLAGHQHPHFPGRQLVDVHQRAGVYRPAQHQGWEQLGGR